MKYKMAACLAFYLQMSMANLYASPDGSDLLLACNHALDTGFDSIQGQMCTWYVLPCNCSYDEELPAVCAPDDIEVSALAAIVVNGLKNNEDFMNQTAANSATIILSKKFPCNEKSDD
jgi:hypothetical protein